MTTNIEQVVTTIVQQLAGRIPTVHVDHMVDNIEDYRIAHPRGVLLVHCPSSTFGKYSVAVRRQLITIDVYVLSRSLRGPAGIHALIESVHMALCGWRPIPSATARPIPPSGEIPPDEQLQPERPPVRAGRMVPVRQVFVSRGTAHWQYVVTYEFSTPLSIERDARAE